MLNEPDRFSFGHRFRSGPCQDLDAPAVGKLDGAQSHDFEAGIETFTDPRRPCGASVPVGRSAGLRRLP